jgi:hypothetical protein
MYIGMSGKKIIQGLAAGILGYRHVDSKEKKGF